MIPTMLWIMLMMFYLVANVGYTLLLKSSPLPKANRHIAHLMMTGVLCISAFAGMLLGYGDWSPSYQVWLLILLQAGFFFGVNQLNILALNRLNLEATVLILDLLRTVNPDAQWVHETGYGNRENKDVNDIEFFSAQNLAVAYSLKLTDGKPFVWFKNNKQ